MTVKIDKNSLSYRLYHVYGQNPADDIRCGQITICQYFRGVMVGVLMALVIVMVGVMAGLGLVQGLGSITLSLMYGSVTTFFPVSNDPGIGTLALALFFLEVCAGITVLGYLTKEKYKDWYYANKGYKVTRNETPGVFRTWLKAKKDKFCPIIDFKEENHEKN